jgi:hypothetical protein
MVIEVQVDNLIDKAIIKSFDKAEKGMLPRKTIIRMVKKLIGENEPVIAKRIENMSKESCKYLMRTSKGIYKLNPEIEFKPIGELLPPEAKIVEVSSEIMAEHAVDLKKAIKNWIENTPEIPYDENSNQFYEKVEKCERYPLFKDLSNHLPESGYDICQRWEKIKKSVKEVDRKKEELLKLIEKNISYIFQGLSLKFVRRYSNLNNYECSLPFLIYESVIYTRIGVIKVYRKYEGVSDEEDELVRFAKEVNQYESHFYITKDRLSDMIIFEKEDSIIWGETEEIFNKGPYIKLWECIRVPKKDIDILRKSIYKAISVYAEPTSEMEKTIAAIIAEVDQLEQDREYLRGELQDSLYCKIFLGECKYLGGRIQ